MADPRGENRHQNGHDRGSGLKRQKCSISKVDHDVDTTEASCTAKGSTQSSTQGIAGTWLNSVLRKAHGSTQGFARSPGCASVTKARTEDGYIII